MPEKDITPVVWKIELVLMDVDGVITDGQVPEPRERPISGFHRPYFLKHHNVGE